MSKAASRPELEELHAALATELAQAIKEVETFTEEAEDGSRVVVATKRNAAILSVARQFLKDNNVDCAPGRPSKPLQALAATLPFTPDGDDGEDRTYQ